MMLTAVLPNAPLLAIDAGGIVGLIFVIITILSWLAQILGGKNAKGPPPQQRMGNPARPLPDKLQEGLELFKRMVAEQQKQQQGGGPQADRGSDPRGGGGANSPRTGSGRKSEKRRTAQDSGSTSKKPKIKPEKQTTAVKDRESLGGDISRRHLPVESDMRQHILQDAQKNLSINSISEQVGQDLNREVSREFSEHLGARQEAQRSDTRGRIQAVRGLLRNRESISQAILINEILQRPLSLRKK